MRRTRRALLEPIAAAVFRQEAQEGDLRSAHARLRACAAEAALCGGGPAELVPASSHALDANALL